MSPPTPAGLPAFDPEAPVWADLLWSAARRRDERSIAVLVDHCRRHDAEPVSRWLADGPGAYRWLAGRLLVEGVPARARHTDAFVASLGHALRGDLSTPHRFAAEFLELAALAHIPAVREVLAAAVRDAAWDPPWGPGPAIATALAAHDPGTATRIVRERIAGTSGDARVSAAGVLAKVDARHVTAAVETIRTTAGANRWHTIGVLVDLAPRLTGDQAGQVAELVREVVRTSPLPSTQAGAGRLLARLGPRYTAEVVGLLRHLPRGEDDDRDGAGRPAAARGLLEVDPPHTDEAIALLRTVLADPNPHLLDQLHAAATLGGLGPAYEDEAAEAVRAVARSAGGWPSVAVAAARTLAGLGRRYAEEAAGALRAVLAGATPSAPATGRYQPPRPDTDAAAELAALGPPYTAEAAATLRDMIRPVDVDRSVSAARALAGIGPRHVGAATGALRRLLAGSALDADARVRVVRALAELDDRHDDDVTAALRAVAADPGAAEPHPLVDHLRELARDHPRYTAAVADAMGAVMLGAVTRRTPSARGRILGAVRDLTELSADHAAVAADVLRAVIDDPADVSERIIAATALVEVAPTAVGEVVESLVAVVTGTDRGDAGHALGRLAGLGHDHRDRVADALRRLLAGPGLDAHTRIRAALELAELDQEHDADITAAVRRVAADPATGEPYALISTLRDLVRDRPKHADDAAAAVVAVATVGGADPWTRVHGAEVLLRLGPSHTHAAAGILRGVLADPAAAAPPAIGAASALAALGPEHTADALRTLRAVAADAAVSAHDRYRATLVIKELE